jgi:hypothetical protein
MLKFIQLAIATGLVLVPGLVAAQTHPDDGESIMALPRGHRCVQGQG